MEVFRFPCAHVAVSSQSEKQSRPGVKRNPAQVAAFPFCSASSFLLCSAFSLPVFET